MDLKLKLEDGKRFLLSKLRKFPEIVVTLGSGLNGLLDDIEVEAEIPYTDIPHCKTSSVVGHRGRLLVGKYAGKRVAVMQGRPHYYELFDIHEVVFPFRLFGWTGAQKFLLTNAAGSLFVKNKPGSLVLIKDHINLLGTNPLLGPNPDFLGTRFPGLVGMYESDFAKRFEKASKKTKVALPKGVYAALHGPSFETIAEIESYRRMGATLVGMSTVPEAIALQHMGKEICAISYVSNLVSGLAKEAPNHEEVLENSKKVLPQFAKLLKGVFNELK